MNTDGAIPLPVTACPMCGLSVLTLDGRIYPHKATEHPIGERLSPCLGSLWARP